MVPVRLGEPLLTALPSLTIPLTEAGFVILASRVLAAVSSPVFQMSTRVISWWGSDAEQMFAEPLRVPGTGPSVGLRWLLCNHLSF